MLLPLNQFNQPKTLRRLQAGVNLQSPPPLKLEQVAVENKEVRSASQAEVWPVSHFTSIYLKTGRVAPLTGTLLMRFTRSGVGVMVCCLP
ncbi:hypothetical protein Q7C36_003171 [Tachysurus vachellii]|uniref:Uncharacterized protein n=1 Tax=Tachysurus vachellii TaxID=175792 RepID=A0AA88NPH5_TACVA|nr:hypothetical protein Q7C36_003171 [Tachysurus vachellii]